MSALKDIGPQDTIENLKKKEPEAPKRTWWYRIMAFIKHRTVWRIVAIAAAIAATILSGGAAIPIAMLATTFIASLIGVVGKAVQVRNVEKYKLQSAMTKALQTKNQSLEDLRKTHEKILAVVAHNKTIETPHSIKVKELSQKEAFRKTIRDVGLENALSFIAFSSASNVIGALAYVVGVGSSIKNIKEEFDVRVQSELDKNKTKLEINAYCKAAGIAPYKNTQELSARFREEMIEFEAQKQLCDTIGDKYKNKDLSEADKIEIKKDYEAIKTKLSNEMKFHLPEEISFASKLGAALNPLNTDPINRFENTTIDTTYTIHSRIDGAKRGSPSGTTPTKTPQIVQGQGRILH